MRFNDLARSALGGLWRQKARTMLTLTGVIVGACSFCFTLSLGVGLRQMIDREFQHRDEFWWIRAYSPNRGTVKESDDEIPAAEIAVDPAVPEPARSRFRQMRINEYRASHPPKDLKLITPAMIEQLRAIPDVEEVRVQRNSHSMVSLGEKTQWGQTYAGKLDIFDPPLEQRLVAGRIPVDATSECLVNEYLLYNLGLREPARQETAIGQTLTITIGESDVQKGYSLGGALGPSNPAEMISRGQAQIFEKIVKQFPDKLDHFDLTPLEKAAIKMAMTRPTVATPNKRHSAKGTFTIVGIIRIPTKEEQAFEPLPARVRDYQNWSVLLPQQTGETLFGQLSETVDRGYPEVSVRCRPNGNLRGVADGIEKLGIEQFSLLKWFESAKLEVTLISVGLNVFSVVALVIAGIGITNTLVTTVLERTKEIGILKAVGAKDGDVTAVFLAEGMAVGLLGGLLGVLFARLIAIPADKLVINLVHKVSQREMTTTSVFEFPIWILLCSVAFALIVTTLAAWYPARRAARVDPVEALRHE